MRAKSVGAEDLSIYLGRGVVVSSMSFEGGTVHLYEKWETSKNDRVRIWFYAGAKILHTNRQTTNIIK